MAIKKFETQDGIKLQADDSIVDSQNNSLLGGDGTGGGSTGDITFDGEWNAITNRIEITCQPTSTTNSVNVSVHALEMLSND